MARIVALDIGERNTGLAISDETQTIARPFDYTVSPRSLIATLRQIMEEHEVEALVVGKPLTLAGEAGKQAQAVESVVEKIRSVFDILVIAIDERLTTRQAQQLRPLYPDAPVDCLAALLLLEHYLKSRDQ